MAVELIEYPVTFCGESVGADKKQIESSMNSHRYDSHAFGIHKLYPCFEKCNSLFFLLLQQMKINIW